MLVSLVFVRCCIQISLFNVRREPKQYKKKNPYCVLLISLLDMQNNVLSAAAVPLFLEAKRLFCSVRFQKEKLADQWSRLASVTPLGHDKRSVLTVGPWPNCQIAKQHKIKTLKTIT